MTSQTDALDRVTRYEFDVMGRRTARVLPMLQRETFAHALTGELSRRVDFAGRATTHAHEAQAGRISIVTLHAVPACRRAAVPRGGPSSLSREPERLAAQGLRRVEAGCGEIIEQGRHGGDQASSLRAHENAERPHHAQSELTANAPRLLVVEDHLAVAELKSERQRFCFAAADLGMKARCNVLAREWDLDEPRDGDSKLSDHGARC